MPVVRFMLHPDRTVSKFSHWDNRFGSFLSRNNRQKTIPFSRIIGADAVQNIPKTSNFTHSSLFSPFIRNKQNTGPFSSPPTSLSSSSSSSSESTVILRIAELYEPRHVFRQNYRTGNVERCLRVHTFYCVCPLTEAEKAVLLIRTLTLGPIKRSKHIFIILNPHSGNHKAIELFETRIAPLFEFAGLHYTTTITDHAGHAIELGKTFNAQKYEGVMFISGDGVVQEFVSGVLSRFNWRTLVRRVPLCSVACGTANALAVGLRTTNPEYAALCVIKRKLRPLDALLVSNGNGLRTVSLCGVGWGIAGDIAIRSEAYRFLGTARYNILKLILGASIFFGRTIHHATIDYSADIAMDDVALAAYFAQPIVPANPEPIEEWKHKRWLSVLNNRTNNTGDETKNTEDDRSNVLDTSIARHRLLQSIINPLPDRESNLPLTAAYHHSHEPTYQVPPEERIAKLRVSRSALEMYTSSNVDEITNAARLAVLETGGRPVTRGIGHIMGRDSMDIDAKTLAGIDEPQQTVLGKESIDRNVKASSLTDPCLGITNISAPSIQIITELSKPHVQASAVSQSGNGTPLSVYSQKSGTVVNSSIDNDARAIIVQQEKAMDESIVHPYSSSAVMNGTSSNDTLLPVTTPNDDVPPSTIVSPELLENQRTNMDGNPEIRLTVPTGSPITPSSLVEPETKHVLPTELGFGVLVPCGRSCNICRAHGRLRYLGHWREAVVLSTLEPRTPPAPQRIFSFANESATQVQLLSEATDNAVPVDQPPPPPPITNSSILFAHAVDPIKAVHRENIFRRASPVRHENQPFTSLPSNSNTVNMNNNSHLQVHIPSSDEQQLPWNHQEEPFSTLPNVSPSQLSETSHLCYDQPPSKPGEERFYSTEGSWATPLPTHKELSFHYRPRKVQSLPSAGIRALRTEGPLSSSENVSSNLLSKAKYKSPSFFNRYSHPFVRYTQRKAQPNVHQSGVIETTVHDQVRRDYPLPIVEDAYVTDEEDITTAPVTLPLPIHSKWGRAMYRLSRTMGIASTQPSMVSVGPSQPIGPEPQHVWQHIELVPTTVAESPVESTEEEKELFVEEPGLKIVPTTVVHKPRLSITHRGFEKRHEGGQYVTVAAVNTGKDGAYTHASDGYVDLIIARRGGLVPTMGLLLRYVFAGVCGLGDERSSPLYDYIKCRSIVLTPSPKVGPDVCVNVDGEVLPGPAPFRIHLLPSLLTAYGDY